jgi:hypothetical protein
VLLRITLSALKNEKGGWQGAVLTAAAGAACGFVVVAAAAAAAAAVVVAAVAQFEVDATCLCWTSRVRQL